MALNELQNKQIRMNKIWTVIFGLLLPFFTIGQEKSTVFLDSVLAQLSLDEKIAMVHAQSKFSSPGVARLGIPEIWMSDGPHGVRAEIEWDSWKYAGWTNDSITAFPALTCLAATFNQELSYQYGRAIGEEARYRKKDILLGPGVNIYRTPLNGRNFEYMGEDPYLASQLVVPYIKGVQENGVAACVKHYALNNQELWRGHINVNVGDRALHEIYLPAFKAAVVEGQVWSIMGAYNQFRGQHCCHHQLLLNEILKKDWAFDGVVVTDWGGAHDTEEAALYGLDIEMGTGTNGLTYSETNAYDNYYLASAFKEKIIKGEIKESVLDDKVKRILRLIYRTSLSENRPLGRVNTKDHHEVARKVAQEGIVLMKNDDNFFPLDATRPITIAVIGENATRAMTKGGGSSELKPQFEISPLEGIQKRFKNATVVHTLGYGSGPAAYGKEVPSPYNADSLKKEAIHLAEKADVVLFFGGLNKNHFQDCEGGDRLEYQLPFGQSALLRELSKANSNLGVVLVSGNAVETPWLGDVKGLIQAWYLGSMSGTAMADVIAGDINPSGKLPFSFPKKLTDNAAHSFGAMSYPGDSINQEYKEGILVGYRWHDTKNIEPAFAFGHGLSYTQFEVDQIKVDKTKYSKKEPMSISFHIKNTGLVAGAEVVQIYIGKHKSAVERATKELKGYKKIHLNKGEEQKVNIHLNTDSFTYYDVKTKSMEVEKGAYWVYVGNASNHIFKKIKITID